MEASDFPTYTDLESQASCDVLNLLLAVVLDTQVTALVSSHAQIKLFMASPRHTMTDSAELSLV